MWLEHVARASAPPHKELNAITWITSMIGR